MISPERKGETLACRELAEDVRRYDLAAVAVGATRAAVTRASLVTVYRTILSGRQAGR